MPSGSGRRCWNKAEIKSPKGFRRRRWRRKGTTCREKNIKIRKNKEHKEETGLNSRLKAQGDMRFFIYVHLFLSRKMVNGRGSHDINLFLFLLGQDFDVDLQVTQQSELSGTASPEVWNLRNLFSWPQGKEASESVQQLQKLLCELRTILITACPTGS